jgi:hypothetical protein
LWGQREKAAETSQGPEGFAMMALCRNPQCRTKLATPTPNKHHAFCGEGCHEGFYDKRCRVCESTLPRQERAGRKLCRKSDCKPEYYRNRSIYDFVGSDTGLKLLAKETPNPRALNSVFRGHPVGQKRPAVVAGPKLSEFALQAAGLQLDPHYAEHLRRENVEPLRRHLVELAKKATFQRKTAPLNVIGGYRFPNAPAVDLSPLPDRDDQIKRSDWKPCSPSSPIAEGLTIPEFLRRAGGGR